MALVVLALLLVGPAPTRAGEALSAVEADFREAIRRVTPATVVCQASHPVRGSRGTSSGVIVTPGGLVLSDSDAGLVFGRGIPRSHSSSVDVRLPSASGRYTTYRARVLHRDAKTDTSVLQILNLPAGVELPYVPPGRSDHLHVGDFVFALGTASDDDGRHPPILTVGLVASLAPRKNGTGGQWEHIYTTAAVNEGVNGGPVVDLDGRLVGTISTFLDPDPNEPYQFLGKVVPMDRILESHRRASAAAALYRFAKRPRGDTGKGRALETVFHAATNEVYPGVVSIDVDRRRPVSNLLALEGQNKELPRYRGPFSGVVVDRDGTIVTSLYNLTNVGTLADPLWTAPASAGVDEGLADVRSIRVHFPDGVHAPAELLGHDEQLGVALLKADLDRAGPGGRRYVPKALAPASPEAYREGRFVLAVGNPWGRRPLPAPLVSMGILSKEHPLDVGAAWRGQWQTDAAGLDSNAGGACIDLDGRLVGILTLWNPARHGRNSGIAFVVPWPRIQARLDEMRADGHRERGFLGVRFGGGMAPRIAEVVSGSAAERAGHRPGGVIRRIDREEVGTVEDVVAYVAFRFADEQVHLLVERDGRFLRQDVVLGAKTSAP